MMDSTYLDHLKWGSRLLVIAAAVWAVVWVINPTLEGFFCAVSFFGMSTLLLKLREVYAELEVAWYFLENDVQVIHFTNDDGEVDMDGIMESVEEYIDSLNTHWDGGLNKEDEDDTKGS